MQSRTLDVVWRFYDPFMSLLGRLGLSSARARLVGTARGRTLEVGAGTGLNLPLYPASATPLVALDVAMPALRRAKARGSRALLIKASVEALPFPEGTFDTVIGALVFCSVPHPAAGLAEVRRVMRPAGQLRLLEHVQPPGVVLGVLARVLTPLWRLISGGCHLDRRTLSALAPAGLSVVSSQLSFRGAALALEARPSTEEERAAEKAAAVAKAAAAEKAAAEKASAAAKAAADRAAEKAAAARAGEVVSAPAVKSFEPPRAEAMPAAVREIPIDGTLDLHTVQPAEARAMVEEYLEVCQQRGILEVRVIHGKGTGVLRLLVHAALSRSPLVKDFRPADEAAGGWGATLVSLKPRP
jgi:DNA-nicking Smr family endonuclease/ubiquinone/menaquinone biosynthesis C-methylase UbiE